MDLLSSCNPAKDYTVLKYLIILFNSENKLKLCTVVPN